MFLKRFVYTLCALTFFNLSAQETAVPNAIDSNQEVLFAVLDLSQISDNNGFDYEVSSIADAQAIYFKNAQNIMLADNFEQAELENYLNSMLMYRHPMEKTGRILTYVGVPLAILGGIMAAGADEHYYECVNGNCSGDAKGAFGAIFLGAGTGLSITGTVLWIIGSKK